jgi:hypothetical protein
MVSKRAEQFVQRAFMAAELQNPDDGSRDAVSTNRSMLAKSIGQERRR